MKSWDLIKDHFAHIKNERVDNIDNSMQCVNK